MPRPRTPLAILQITGTATRSDRKAVRAVPERRLRPKGDRLGAPPRHLDAEHRAAWRELARLAPAGLLSKSDRVIVEVAVRLTVRLRHDRLTAAEVGHLRAALNALGLTPSSRESLSLPQPEKPTDGYDF